LLICLKKVYNAIQYKFCCISFRISTMTTVSTVLLMVFVKVELYGAIAHSPSPVCDTNIMYQKRKLQLHSQFIDLSNRFFVRITMVAYFCFLNAKTDAFNKMTEQFKYIQQIELHSSVCVTT
jgi:hypothetical protein